MYGVQSESKASIRPVEAGVGAGVGGAGVGGGVGGAGVGGGVGSLSCFIP